MQLSARIQLPKFSTLVGPNRVTPGKLLAILICLALLSPLGVAGTSRVSTKVKISKPSKKRPRAKVRRIRWNPVLRGSYESMLRQNEEIDRLQLPRIEDDAQLEDLILKQELVEIQESKSLRVAANLDPERRYCRPWTLSFLEDLGDAFYARFKAPIQVNSAVRTVAVQKKLRRRNRNAAPELGDTASSHLAGLTVDIAKTGLTRTQRKWLDAYLMDLRNRNLIEAAEERRQPVYHIMVSERYDGYREERQSEVSNRQTDIVNQD